MSDCEKSENEPLITTQPGTCSTQESKTVETGQFERGGDGGIEVLNTLNGLVVKQRVQMIEVITGIDVNNKYDIYAPTGELLFHAYEKSRFLMRFCAGSRRPFEMHIIDAAGQEFIRVKRKFSCCSCRGDDQPKLRCCCNEAIKVESPPGNEIGRVYQTCGTMLKFYVCDASGRIAKIVGPSFLGMGCCTCCYPNKVFRIYADDGTEIGTITKKFGGLLKELFTNADIFHVEFPEDFSVEEKSLILSTVFLIALRRTTDGGIKAPTHKRHKEALLHYKERQKRQIKAENKDNPAGHRGRDEGDNALNMPRKKSHFCFVCGRKELLGEIQTNIDWLRCSN
ncbi:hypothetical protein ANCCEY_07107 [Ancylostoma ceylanicum]|uniref:Phospholipid scramblase n=1 Tax=Ancylostoma ceylanicum TaxID=53326 RepID=A0A0D6M1R6_9BILA|nr:hypothetical protein ANCCEY_07107 [Ancylostoma ceylanicum]